ncbi:MAG: aminotransferase class I/II-fold pyridoxal phosphate-dependent enzyme, partial [Steroidobacteraceae bacterium]
VRDGYRARRDRMIAAVQRELPQVKFDAPEGGYYLWLTLPPDVDGDALAKRAAEVGVNVIPGSKFYAGSRKSAERGNHIRLSYSFASLEQIDLGLHRLADVYREQIAA